MSLLAVNLPKPIEPLQLYDALTNLLEGRPIQGDREKCLEAGMDDYIGKPVNMADLANALSKCPPKE